MASNTSKKSTTKQPKKMGRPRKQIDKRQFEAMCGLQCTLEEICEVIGVDDCTLNKWCKETYDGRTYSEVFREKRGLGKMSLRRTQFKLAEKSATMAIFLGKQYLGQTDKVEVVDNTPIERLDAILGGIKKIAEATVDGNSTITETE